MYHRKQTERGQALILIALAAVGLFAFSALAIDGSKAWSTKRHAQNAADTSVLAGALAAIRCTNGTPNPCTQLEAFNAAQDAAEKRAISNGFTDGEHNVIVQVDLCSAPVPATQPCKGLDPSAAPEEYLRVRITSEVPTFFGRVIGRKSFTASAEAIARVNGSSSFSSFPGQAVVALSPDDCGICTTGAGNLKVYGSGMFSNSTAVDTCNGNPNAKNSMLFWGSSDIYSEQGFYMPVGGGFCVGNATNVNAVSADPAASVAPVYNIQAPSISCSGTGSIDTTNHVVHPGTFASSETLNNGDWTFLDGNYCFQNGFVNKGNTVANHVNFRIDGGQLEFKGDVFSCTDMTVYGAGGDGLKFGGNGSINCTDVTFYMASGGVTMNGNSSKNTMTARTSGKYKGLLIYLPASNPSLIRMNGNSNSRLVGSIIAPGSTIALSGNSASAGHDTQLIGWKIDIQGSSNTVIHFNPANQYHPPQNPTIQLTK